MAFEASQIGELAGIVWRTLESKGKLNLEELSNYQLGPDRDSRRFGLART